jgi:hypothetical protein
MKVQYMKESSSSLLRHDDSQVTPTPPPQKTEKNHKMRYISLNHKTATLLSHKHTIPSVTQAIYLYVVYSRLCTKFFFDLSQTVNFDLTEYVGRHIDEYTVSSKLGFAESKFPFKYSPHIEKYTTHTKKGMYPHTYIKHSQILN